MRKLKSLIIIYLLGLLSFQQFAFASDTAKEQRWAEQIVDSLLVGNAEWLQAGKDKFLALYSESTTEKTVGGAIVLHGIGVHPDWAEVIQPLRSQLPDHGWATLSLQMPILPNEAKEEDYAPLFNEVAPRIDAAIKFFKSKGVQNVVIVAHSLGSTMAAHYLAGKPDKSVQAFVAIGMNGLEKKEPGMNNPGNIRKIKLPMLDLYGNRDLEHVVKGAKNRATAASKAGNKNYTQVMVDDADHFFNGKSDELVKRVRGWLTNNAAGMEVKLK